MNLSDAIDTYLVLLKGQGADSTHRASESTLRLFLAHVGNINMTSLSNDHVTDYFYGPRGLTNKVSERTGAPLKNASFNNSRAKIKGFLDWATEDGLIKKNPLGRRIKRKPIETRERLRLEPAQMVEAIETATHPRDRIALAVTCNTGLRVASVAGLRVWQVDLEHGYLRKVKTSKTHLEKDRPITADLERELRRWLTYYAEQCGPLQGEWFLVPSKSRPQFQKGSGGPGCKNPIHVSVLQPTKQHTRGQRIVHQALKAQGLDAPGEGFHTLRRSAGRVMFESGLEQGDPRAIHLAREFLDHKNVQMTEHYIGTNHEKQKVDEALRGRDFLSKPSAPAEASNVIPLRRVR